MKITNFKRYQRNFIAIYGAIMFFCTCYISLQAGISNGFISGVFGAIWIVILDKMLGGKNPLFRNLSEWQSDIGDFA